MLCCAVLSHAMLCCTRMLCCVVADSRAGLHSYAVLCCADSRAVLHSRAVLYSHAVLCRTHVCQTLESYLIVATVP